MSRQVAAMSRQVASHRPVSRHIASHRATSRHVAPHRAPCRQPTLLRHSDVAPCRHTSKSTLGDVARHARVHSTTSRHVAYCPMFDFAMSRHIAIGSRYGLATSRTTFAIQKDHIAPCRELCKSTSRHVAGDMWCRYPLCREMSISVVGDIAGDAKTCRWRCRRLRLPKGSSTPESSMEMALPRQNLIPRQNFNPTLKPPTPQHTTKTLHLHAKAPRRTLPWGRNGRRFSLALSLIFSDTIGRFA